MNYEKIKTFEDACALLKYDSNNVIPDLSLFPEKDRSALEAHCKLVIIADALNRLENDGDEWFPDWSNYNEYKYTPWFDMDPSSASGFAFGGYDDWYSDSNVGSRLCYKTRELAEYAGKQFEDLYKMKFVK